jgi:hypothetical protein
MGLKAALIKAVTAVALLALLAGCSATPQALEAGSATASQSYAANYLEVHQRLSGTARRCLTSNGARLGSIDLGSIEVEADLHQERSFGEVRFVVAGTLSTNYFLSARIEKSGNGSRVSVKVNNPLIGERLSNMVFRWAGGDQNC